MSNDKNKVYEDFKKTGKAPFQKKDKNMDYTTRKTSKKPATKRKTTSKKKK